VRFSNSAASAIHHTHRRTPPDAGSGDAQEWSWEHAHESLGNQAATFAVTMPQSGTTANGTAMSFALSEIVVSPQPTVVAVCTEPPHRVRPGEAFHDANGYRCRDASQRERRDRPVDAALLHGVGSARHASAG